MFAYAASLFMIHVRCRCHAIYYAFRLLRHALRCFDDAIMPAITSILLMMPLMPLATPLLIAVPYFRLPPLMPLMPAICRYAADALRFAIIFHILCHAA